MVLESIYDLQVRALCRQLEVLEDIYGLDDEVRKLIGFANKTISHGQQKMYLVRFLFVGSSSFEAENLNGALSELFDSEMVYIDEIRFGVVCQNLRSLRVKMTSNYPSLIVHEYMISLNKSIAKAIGIDEIQLAKFEEL